MKVPRWLTERTPTTVGLVRIGNAVLALICLFFAVTAMRLAWLVIKFIWR